MEGLSPLVNCRSMNSCGRRIPDKSGGRRGPRWELLRRKCRPPVGGPAQALFPAGNPFAIRRSGLLANFEFPAGAIAGCFRPPGLAGAG